MKGPLHGTQAEIRSETCEGVVHSTQNLRNLASQRLKAFDPAEALLPNQSTNRMTCCQHTMICSSSRSRWRSGKSSAEVELEQRSARWRCGAKSRSQPEDRPQSSKTFVRKPARSGGTARKARIKVFCSLGRQRGWYSQSVVCRAIVLCTMLLHLLDRAPLLWTWNARRGRPCPLRPCLCASAPESPDFSGPNSCPCIFPVSMARKPCPPQGMNRTKERKSQTPRPHLSRQDGSLEGPNKNGARPRCTPQDSQHGQYHGPEGTSAAWKNESWQVCHSSPYIPTSSVAISVGLFVSSHLYSDLPWSCDPGNQKKQIPSGYLT